MLPNHEAARHTERRVRLGKLTLQWEAMIQVGEHQHMMTITFLLTHAPPNFSCRVIRKTQLAAKSQYHLIPNADLVFYYCCEFIRHSHHAFFSTIFRSVHHVLLPLSYYRIGSVHYYLFESLYLSKCSLFLTGCHSRHNILILST